MAAMPPPRSIAHAAESDFYATRHKIHYYGAGDHGGGPAKESIAAVEQNRRVEHVAEFSSAQSFFEGIEAEKVEFPGCAG